MADTFQTVLTAAVADFAEHGYDSVERLAYWERLLRQAAEAQVGSRPAQDELVRKALGTIYAREVERGGVLKLHPGVSRFTVDRVKPQLRAALDRRIAANANLIRLNRPQAVDKTMQRFSGWATSQPPGGAAEVNRRKVKIDVSKPLKQCSFEERRVLIDQGHKLAAAISETLAEGGDVLGGLWHSNWRQANYNYRPDHKERDGVFYAQRGSWAAQQGLLASGVVYTDDITRPAEEPFCRCSYRYVYALRDVPRQWLSSKGERALDEARRKARAMMG